jgi:uncharacterized protein YjdB
MPFAFKLARRIARLRTPITVALAASVAVNACDLRRNPMAGTENPVTQVIVSPDRLTLNPLQDHLFQVYGRTQLGDSVPVSVTWTASVGAITPYGAYTADTAAAAAIVTATFTRGNVREPISDTAVVTVLARQPPPPPPPPPPPAPGAVTDLRVTDATDSSVTLSFTEVSDGAGQPARYDIRWATGAIVWPSASRVTQGSCAAPLTGTVVGATRSCTVLGLAASTVHAFQLAAFRGTLNLDAVFGALSNVANDTTSASTAPVASVTVSPASATVLVGGVQLLTATLRDARGNVLTGRPIVWVSSNPLVASVSAGGGGLVGGLLDGPATISATSEGQSGTAAVTVALTPPPPPDGPWPNEPAGFTVLTDEPFNALVENGWRQTQRETTNGSGLFVASDLLAPLSASSVLEFKFAAGYTGGREPGVEYYRPAAPVKESYFAFWWRPSSPWQSHSSGVNKLAFLYTAGGGGCIYIMMFNEGGSYTIQVEPEFSGDVRRLAPNVTGTPVVLGAWHRVEWYVKYSTTGSRRDGVTRWWIDGVLQGEYRDLQMPADAGFAEYQLAPTWGGLNGTKAKTDHYWYDHARISKR